MISGTCLAGDSLQVLCLDFLPSLYYWNEDADSIISVVNRWPHSAFGVTAPPSSQAWIGQTGLSLCQYSAVFSGCLPCAGLQCWGVPSALKSAVGSQRPRWVGITDVGSEEGLTQSDKPGRLPGGGRESLANGNEPCPPARTWLGGRSKPTAWTGAWPGPQAFVLLLPGKQLVAKTTQARQSLALHPVSLCYKKEMFFGHLGHLWPSGAGGWGGSGAGLRADRRPVSQDVSPGSFSTLTRPVEKAHEGSL